VTEPMDWKCKKRILFRFFLGTGMKIKSLVWRYIHFLWSYFEIQTLKKIVVHTWHVIQFHLKRFYYFAVIQNILTVETSNILPLMKLSFRLENYISKIFRLVLNYLYYEFFHIVHRYTVTHKWITMI